MEQNIKNIDLDIFQYMKNSDSQYFFLADIETGVCRWSENAKELLAISEDYSVAFNWKSLIHPLEYQKFMDLCQDIRRRHTKQFCEEFRFCLKNGGYIWVQCSASMVVASSDDKVLLSGIVTVLNIENTFDPVTTLRYITSFRCMLSEIVKDSVPWGVLLIGIDDFKRINDLYSYSFGDEVLEDFARRTEMLIPIDAHLFRLDGDSFGILYPKAEINSLITLFDELQKMAQRPSAIQDSYVSFTLSGGICHYPEDGKDGDTLYRNVHIAYVESKRRGKRQVTVCTAPLCAQTQRRMKLLETLTESVQDKCRGFSLRYQPLIYAKNEELYGCEVLMRWVHPEFPDGVSPYEFISILEGSGLIFEVNKWLLQEAFEQCVKWLEWMPEFQMSLNFSYIQFEDPNFQFTIMNMLKQSGIPASAITLELTEGEEIKDTEKISEAFSFLRSQGVKVALDDFGMGYSSLSVFQMLQVDELKVDRSFLQRLAYDVTDQVLVRQIIELCHSMNIMVCVEGIENSHAAEMIKQFGAEILQGFYFDTPLTNEVFEQKYLMNRQSGVTAPRKVVSEQDGSMIYSPIRPTKAMGMDMIINNAYAGIFQVAMDKDFSFITCNEGYRRMLGYTARDIEVKFSNNALGIVYPEDMEYVNEEIRRQLGEGDTITVEFRVVRSDGVPIWILGSGNVVKTADGGASLIVIIIENDKFKKKQLEIERKFQRNDRILSNIPVGVKCVEHNEDFDIEYMSPAFLSLLGFEESDLDTMFQKKYIRMVQEEDRTRIVSEVLEQLEYGNIVTSKYRSICKNGENIWVETISRLCPPEEDGIQRWYSSVVNITDSITEEQKNGARDFANRIKNASSQWGDVIFEYDFMTNQVSFSENYNNLFERHPEEDILAEAKSIHEKDRELLEKALYEVHQGVQPDPIEVRYYSEKKGYIWMSIQFSKPCMIGNDFVSVIGRMTNVDKERKRKEELFFQSRIDGLTGVLNKISIEEDIRDFLLRDKAKKKAYALCVIDTDDFKGINDRMGHIFGDQVLIHTAMRLHELFDGKAMLGRAGGDEFILFVEINEMGVENIGRSIVEVLRKPIEFEGYKVSISASVGISLYPQHGEDFYKLFKIADGALYLVKAKGKGNYHIAAGINKNK